VLFSVELSPWRLTFTFNINVEHFHFRTFPFSMAPSTATGLSNLQDHLSLISNRPHVHDIPILSKDLRAQATNCIRFSEKNNDLLEFLGDRLVNLVAALIVEEVKVDKCHHTVRLLDLTKDFFERVCLCDAIHQLGRSLRDLQ
jgi:hypothetical protein